MRPAFLLLLAAAAASAAPAAEGPARAHLVVRKSVLDLPSTVGEAATVVVEVFNAGTA
jgi:hypothetical protein